MKKAYASRKFILFLISTVAAVCGWVYALIYRPEQLATVSTFVVALLSAYSGANLTDTYLNNNKSTDQTKKESPYG